MEESNSDVPTCKVHQRWWEYAATPSPYRCVPQCNWVNFLERILQKIHAAPPQKLPREQRHHLSCNFRGDSPRVRDTMAKCTKCCTERLPSGRGFDAQLFSTDQHGLLQPVLQLADVNVVCALDVDLHGHLQKGAATQVWNKNSITRAAKPSASRHSWTLEQSCPEAVHLLPRAVQGAQVLGDSPKATPQFRFAARGVHRSRRSNEDPVPTFASSLSAATDVPCPERELQLACCAFNLGTGQYSLT